MYDRPPKIFHPITLEEKHNWYRKLSSQYPQFGHCRRSSLYSMWLEETYTAFTHYVEDKYTLRSDRPGIIFSSTSWTEDEDFGILIDALQGEYKDFKSVIW